MPTKVPVKITDTKTGESAVYSSDGVEVNMYDHWSRTNYEYWWTEGNFACDCNRKMCFERATGIEVDYSDDSRYPCNLSGNRYVTEILWPPIPAYPY